RNGREYYNYRTLNFLIICISKAFAKPTLHCPEGYVPKKSNAALCRKREMKNYILECPEDYVLNEVSLLSGTYSRPTPTCIGKLRTRTQYYCLQENDKPEDSLSPSNTTRMFIEDVKNLRCTEVILSLPTFSPSTDIVEKLYPGYLESQNSSGNLYPGLHLLS
ncbi:hypothetical protein IE077_002540, partial [Cardiosporidium cionae]